MPKKRIASNEPAPVLVPVLPEETPDLEKITLMVQAADCEEFLCNLNATTKYIDAVATVLDSIDPHELRAESLNLIDRSTALTSMAGVLKAHANEIRIDVRNFHRHYCETGIVHRLFKAGSAWQMG